MTGDDVKRQVIEALRSHNRLTYADALAPCIVLTAEEAADVARAVQDPTWNPDDTRLLALLTPNQEVSND